MKFEALAETCELETKNRTNQVDENLNIINEVTSKVEAVISSKLEEFNKTVNTVETPPINNNNDNAGDSTGNNESANGSAEQE